MTIEEEIQALIERATKLAERLEAKREMKGPSEAMYNVINDLETIQEDITDIGERDDEADLPDDSED